MSGPYRTSSRPEPDPFPHVDGRVRLVRTGNWQHGNFSSEWVEESGQIKLIVTGTATDGTSKSIRTTMTIDDAEALIGAIKRSIVLARKPAPETEG